MEELVRWVRDGKIRVPKFQRGLRWQASNVVELFDSIYKGYPVGALLLRQAHAPAATVSVGPLEVAAQEDGRALWVIDGQQRVTALAAALGRSVPIPSTPSDAYVVYFDPVERAFSAPPRSGDVPTQWVPLPMLVDASALNEWVFGWSRRDDGTLRAAVFDAGKRLREYRVPTYVIETDSEEVLRSIFHRVNNFGVRLEWDEVHDALYGHRGQDPSSLAELAARLEETGMGRPDENEQLLPCLLALRGVDVTRSLGEHLRENPRLLDGAVAEALPVIRQALGFLRARAEVPHLRLLPYSAPLVVLTRFFGKHPEPSDRSQTLLVRWVWRSMFASESDQRVLKRRGVASITEDEEASVQALVALTPVDPPDFRIAEHFDARRARSRLVLLGMASLQPSSLEGTGGLDVAGMIRDHDIRAFRPFFALHGGATRSPANRLLLNGRGAAVNDLRVFIAAKGNDHATLHSHAIDRDVAQAILDRDAERAIHLRSNLLERVVSRLGDRLAEWGRTDRPSLQYLLHLGTDG